jgi:DNA repair protein RecN (Recombination protein N)
MLLSLHVKNLALIEEEEVTFTDGLNILTGETGAGKSIIIGSVNLALGAKADKAIIRTGADYALIEMTFLADNETQIAKLKEMDLPIEEDGTILIKRKILPGRSACSVCGESVTLRQLREIAELLIDIYGQRENQKLLRREAQLLTVDEYAGEEAERLKASVAQRYKKWRALTSEWEKDDLDDAARKREVDLLSYELREIEDAAIRDGEDEELENRYRLLENFRKISEAAGQAAFWTGGSEQSAEEAIARASRELTSVSGIDPTLDRITEELSEVEGLLADFNRSMNDYMRELTFDPAEFEQIQDRLNLINRLKDKYGRSVLDIERALSERQDRLAFLEDYENGRRRLKEDIEKEYGTLLSLCADLSAVRLKAAERFAKKLREALLDLNFPQVEFEGRIRSGEEYLSADGYDRLVFYISMNPGESPRPLDQIASGGELSRIMLGMKTVFAGKDDIHTFIFDEIDTGISGMTAWKVAEKMGRLASDHQILCITHLPQIAACGDANYRIHKESDDDSTYTNVDRLAEEEVVDEIARLLGGETITETTRLSAKELMASVKK